MSDILTKPEWIPWYVQRLKGSSAWRELKDYQWGWYTKLLTELADSDTPGFLPNDVTKLWKLAGAQTESFFKRYGGIELLARHFNRTEDGLRIYNARMLEVLHEQGKKQAKRRSRALSSLLSVLQGFPSWIPEEEFRNYIDMREQIKKPLTAQALKLAVRKLETLKAEGHDPKAVLEQSIFNSWQGLFEVKKPNGNGQKPEVYDPCRAEDPTPEDIEHYRRQNGRADSA